MLREVSESAGFKDDEESLLRVKLENLERAVLRRELTLPIQRIPFGKHAHEDTQSSSNEWNSDEDMYKLSQLGCDDMSLGIDVTFFTLFDPCPCPDNRSDQLHGTCAEEWSVFLYHA